MADHASLTGASLHESKGVATAAINTVYVANGGGSGAWSALAFGQMPSGSVIGFGSTQFSAQDSTTTTIPADDTIPQNTEGKEAFTVSYTPKAATSTLIIDVFANLGSSTTTNVALALFQDTTANALAAAANIGARGTNALWEIVPVTIRYIVSAASTSARTYKVRFGPTGAATAYINRSLDDTTLFGSRLMSNITVTEIKA